MPDAAPALSTTRIVFMGSPEFAEPSLRGLIDAGYALAGVYTQPDRAVGRGQRVHSSPIKQLALQAGLPVYQPESLRRPSAVAELAGLRPDVIVVVAFGQILRPPVLAVPARGVLNVHASLLPRYRGASPIAAALLDGAEETGVTIMLLDAGMDTGPILAQRIEPIEPEDTAGSLSERLATIGAALLIETLPRWLAGEAVPSPQDDALATSTRLLTKEDGRIDWSLSAEAIWHRVRAYAPWPGATTTLNSAPVQLLQAWPVAGGQTAEPGRVVALPGPVIVSAGLPPPAFAVETGSGLLLPLILQKAGRRPLTARDFANGERGLIGARFGA